jgi:hypothetical protein
MTSEEVFLFFRAYFPMICLLVGQRIHHYATRTDVLMENTRKDVPVHSYRLNALVDDGEHAFQSFARLSVPNVTEQLFCSC